MFVQLTRYNADDVPSPVFVNTELVDVVRPGRRGTFVGIVGSTALHVREQIDEVMSLLQPRSEDRVGRHPLYRVTLLQYQQLVLDADAVARSRGDEHGLSDALDKRGQPYVSEWADRLITKAKEDLAAANGEAVTHA